MASSAASTTVRPGRVKSAAPTPADDGQREPDAQQAHRDRELAAKRAQVDPRRIGK